MILRKPYALLIKYFKIIHFILTILTGYTAFKFYNVYKFINGYITSGYYTYSNNLASTYINPLMYASVIIILILLISMILLLMFKKKPVFLYWILFFVFIFSIFLIPNISNTLTSLELETIDIRSLLIVRDICVGVAAADLFLAIYCLFRALGFDVRRFNFNKDMKELKIEAKDNEEFELSVNIDKESIITKLRKRIRYFKYYIIENKRIFVIIISLIITTALGMTLYNIIGPNRIYKENEYITIAGASYKVESSYLLTDKYQEPSTGDNHYIIIRLNTKNNSQIPLKLNTDNFVVKLNNKTYYITKLKYNSFNDIGNGYNNQNIPSNSNKTYIFVYKLDEKIANDKIYLQITNSKTKKKIKLNYISYNKINKNSSSNLKEKLWFTNSTLNKSNLVINSYELSDSFSLTSNNKKYNISLNKLQVEKTILKLDTELVINYDLQLKNMNINNFINCFGVLKYQINDETKTSSLINKTPYAYNGNDVYFEVSSELKEATKIYLELTIRGEKYTYNLKK